MTPRSLYRVAAWLLVFFAAGHTRGLLSPKDLTPEATAAREAMFNLHFPFMGSDCSWGGFYMGFGLFLTTYLVFTAILAWQMGKLSLFHAKEIKFLAWVFAACQAVGTILCWKYFFVPPTITSGLITLCLGLAAWNLEKPTLRG
jgi:hypothetical protein